MSMVKQFLKDSAVVGLVMGLMALIAFVASSRVPPQLPAIALLENNIEFPEKFLGNDAPEFPAMLDLIKKHKGLPDDLRPRVRGITHAQDLVYLALDNNEYRWVAPWEEVKSWK